MHFERGMMGPRRSGDLWVRGPSTFTRDFTAYSVMMMQGTFQMILDKFWPILHV